MVIQLTDCTVTYKDEVLFRPEYGVFDMAIGNKIVSAFAGAADNNSFPNLYSASKTKTIKAQKTENDIALEHLYQKVRTYRLESEYSVEDLSKIYISLREKHNNDWLLPLELLELTNKTDLISEIKSHLNAISKNKPELSHLIESGLKLVETPIAF